MSKCEGSSLLHFKPKRAHSSGFRRADVLYYCSVEIAILRLHSGPRACMHRIPASLFRHSQDNALVPYIRFSHAQAIYILNQTGCKLTKFKLHWCNNIGRQYIEHILYRIVLYIFNPYRSSYNIDTLYSNVYNNPLIFLRLISQISFSAITVRGFNNNLLACVAQFTRRDGRANTAIFRTRTRVHAYASSARVRRIPEHMYTRIRMKKLNAPLFT